MELFSVEEYDEIEGSWGFNGEDSPEELVGKVDYAGGRLRSEIG